MRHFFIMFILVFSLNTFSFSNPISKEYEKKYLKKVSKPYNIKIYYRKFIPSSYSRRHTTFKYLTKNDDNNLIKFSIILYEAWSKYPVDFVKKTNIKAIALVTNMKVVGQKRMAMPDAYGEVLYVDINCVDYGKQYSEHIIHHEYYHMIEQEFNGSMYYKDPNWKLLNKKGFLYGRGGRFMRDSKLTWKKHPKLGFVNGYSTSGLEEDKAEVFAHLLTTGEFKEVYKWFNDDDILRSKFEYMINFLKSISPNFDESYIKKLHQNFEK